MDKESQTATNLPSIPDSLLNTFENRLPNQYGKCMYLENMSDDHSFPLSPTAVDKIPGFTKVNVPPSLECMKTADEYGFETEQFNPIANVTTINPPIPLNQRRPIPLEKLEQDPQLTLLPPIPNSSNQTLHHNCPGPSFTYPTQFEHGGTVFYQYYPDAGHWHCPQPSAEVVDQEWTPLWSGLFQSEEISVGPTVSNNITVEDIFPSFGQDPTKNGDIYRNRNLLCPKPKRQMPNVVPILEKLAKEYLMNRGYKL